MQAKAKLYTPVIQISFVCFNRFRLASMVLEALRLDQTLHWKTPSKQSLGQTNTSDKPEEQKAKNDGYNTLRKN